MEGFGVQVRTSLGELRVASSLRRLPFRIAVFLWRARRHARRDKDAFSLASAIRPVELATLLRVAAGRREVVELGTGTGWSAISLALADGHRRVVSYDPCVRPQREHYLAQVRPQVRDRIEFRPERDSSGPRQGEQPDVLFIDSHHERDAVVDAFSARRDSLAPGAVVAFHDYGHPDYPGVREAVEQLGLDGSARGTLFLWRAPCDAR